MRMKIGALILALAATLAWAGVGMTDANKIPTVTVYVDQQRYEVSSAAATVGGLLQGHGDHAQRSRSHRSKPEAGAEGRRDDSRLASGAAAWSKRSAVEAKTILLPVIGRGTGFTQTLHEGRDGLVRRTVEIWEKDGPGRLTGSDGREGASAGHRSRRHAQRHEGFNRGAGGYVRPRRMRATAYDPSPRCCGPRATGRTACGTKACKGKVAVDPRVIPFGTHLYIPGYGFAVAEDKGAPSRATGLTSVLTATTRQSASAVTT